MMNLINKLDKDLLDLKSKYLYKEERIISTSQGANIKSDGNEVINLCANNYLGLANSPILIKEAKDVLEKYGVGLASVRFICGTQDIHKNLEDHLSKFLHTEDSILYSSCFDANGGFFETIFGKEDAIISDSLNHASVIDGIRLSKASRFRYANNNMEELESQLKLAKNARFKVIATDGVFSMDGIIVNLPAIFELANKYDAWVFLDDSHSVGVLGKNGKGTHEYYNMLEADRLIISGTLGKALGGSSGGYISGPKVIIDYLRQKSRPYLFSNSLAPVIVAIANKAISILEENPQLLVDLKNNSEYFRNSLTELGFTLAGGDHPIMPIMLNDAKLAQIMAMKLLENNIYVIGFFYPVVPKGLARIRIQISSALNKQVLDKALIIFEKIGKELKVI